jgi:putative transposase
MTTATIGDETCSRPRRRPAEAGIVFGSAATAPRRKPDSVRATCEAIGLARSTYYYQSHRSLSAIEFEQKIVLRMHELRELHPDAGYRRMTLQLQAEGFHVNRKRIARLMQLHSLSMRISRPGAYAARGVHVRTPATNLRESVRMTGPYQVWVSDVAYAHIRSSLVYAAAVIDAWSREVVGYAASLQITNRLPRIALHSAVRAHRPAPGCIHHSTCGTQYQTPSYRELLRQYGLVASVEDFNGRSQHAPRSCSNALAPTSRQIVDIQGYETWKEVIERPREFIRAVYSHERVERILGRRSAAELAHAAAN